MIPIIEDYLQVAVQSKLQYLKSNPEYLNKIISTTPDMLGRLKTYISGTPVRVIKGYPRVPSELPCICIILADEQGEQFGLGDYMGDEDNTEDKTETLPVQEEVTVEGVYRYIQTTSKNLISVASLANVDLGQPVSEYDIHDDIHGIIRVYDDDIEEGDTITVVYTHSESYTTILEEKWSPNYKLEVWCTNGDLCVQIYHILKWIFLSQRKSFVQDYDLVIQKLGGGDFEPVPSYFPEFVYRRALTFSCQTSISVPEEEIPYISDVYVNETISLDTNLGGGLGG